MDKYTEKWIKHLIRDMEEAPCEESFRWRAGYVMGYTHAMSSPEERITTEECIDMEIMIDEGCKRYWDKAKVDFVSAHRRLFPEQ